MRRVVEQSVVGLLAFAASTVGASLVWAHDPDARVEIEIEGSTIVEAGRVRLDFELIDNKTSSLLEPKDLAVVHEKKLHLFAFDPALQEFRHEHPEFANGKWSVNTEIRVDGNYWLWAQGKILADGTEFFANARFVVRGGQPANPLPPVLGDVRTGSDRSSRVTISNERLVAKRMAMLNLTFSRTNGSAPALTPYLGALAHVVGVLGDGDTLLHIHPMSRGTPNQLMLHTEFPVAGEYRLWVQFIDGGALKIVPLSVRVFEN